MKKTKEEWIEILHEARRNGDFSEKIDVFGYKDCFGRMADFFVFDCLVALHSRAGDSLAEKMNENSLPKYSTEKIYKDWDNPKSPIRNFLLVRHIDFPEGYLKKL